MKKQKGVQGLVVKVALWAPCKRRPRSGRIDEVKGHGRVLIFRGAAAIEWWRSTQQWQ